MHRSRHTCCALASLALVACHRAARTTPEFLSTNAFRYSARSTVVGAGLDTLRVTVLVTNASDDQRLIVASSGCAPFNRIAATIRANQHKWDSEVWRPVKAPPTYDDSGRAIAYGCAMRALPLPPGTSHSFVLDIPVSGVLGDSLKSGRYVITASVRINGALVRGLDAGQLELGAPPT